MCKCCSRQRSQFCRSHGTLWRLQACQMKAKAPPNVQSSTPMRQSSRSTALDNPGTPRVCGGDSLPDNSTSLVSTVTTSQSHASLTHTQQATRSAPRAHTWHARRKHPHRTAPRKPGRYAPLSSCQPASHPTCCPQATPPLAPASSRRCSRPAPAHAATGEGVSAAAPALAWCPTGMRV